MARNSPTNFRKPGRPARQLSDDERAYLENALQGRVSFEDMAEHIGVHVDTLKRLLMRNGLARFNAAKYARTDPPNIWRRPCIRCGDDAPRHRNQYFCDYCTERNQALATEPF